ncbi:uncharacterized protein LOC117802262 isoform X2 [Ailuropoda melanoleuca]|uniref:uncharacterized protein LOC117802262 isoform X2 n=1 Tax=Ailuropoda melanoleuca TaxID=9646 RepID=UPI00149495CB|nr:uncharacterized protein LOC117802262 isoform X2 [Ailuropoda melanoleuca]
MFCGRGRAVVSVLAGRTGQVQAREADFSSVQRNRLSIGAAQPDPTDRAGFPFFPLLDRHADAEQELSQVTRWSLAVGSCRNVIAFPIFLPRSSSPPFRSPGAFAVRPHGGGFAGGGLSAPRVCPATVTSRPRRRELVAGASGGRRRGGGIRGRRPERVPGLPGNSDVTAPPPRIGSRSLWGRRRGGGMAEETVRGQSHSGSSGTGMPRSGTWRTLRLHRSVEKLAPECRMPIRASVSLSVPWGLSPASTPGRDVRSS